MFLTDLLIGMFETNFSDEQTFLMRNDLHSVIFLGLKQSQ